MIFSIDKPLKTQFTGFTADLKKTLITVLKLNSNISNDELFETLQPVFTNLSIAYENDSLKLEIATLLIEKEFVNGTIQESEKQTYIKLAMVDPESTLSIIHKRHANQIEVYELMKLSAKELYMQGKLERLREISDHHFQIKYKELVNQK